MPADLANQIAAGEVVERPASVVKELIENAIDAGARRLAVHVELGGKKLVRVEDDGEGMEPEDARLAIERHATSKIACAEDLAAIRTLGFRGEALPSIASVSHFVLRTRARDHESGTEIRVSGGTLTSIAEAAAARGTIVEVHDLFYNLPARRKFLKSDAGEAAQVSRIVTQLALGYPEIGFTLTSAGRTVLQCPPTQTLRDRLYQISGDHSDLIEVHKDAGGLQLHGLIAALADSGPVKGPQHLFINRRIVKDRTIAHAIADAYSVASIKERSPEVHLFIDMPRDAVDVNVHPTKAEVRFREPSLVHEVVRRGLMAALGQSGAPEWQLSGEATLLSMPQGAIPRPLPDVLAGGRYPTRWTPPGPIQSTASASVATLTEPAVVSVQPMIPLGQFRETFIIAVDNDGVAIIDQHVAHERVLFERVMERLTNGRLESQRLLVPLVMDVNAGQQQALVGREEELGRLGFEIESFGTGTIKVNAVPALLEIEESSRTLVALAEDLEGLDRGAGVQEALRRIAATTACHAAVKANYPLTYEKMAHILDELRATAYSTICPHGRPVMLRLTRREIEKNFDRI
ncbi:MAG TPA: DNA mismatch repair endonuclease MutL [Vicinamibacterales bacterium]|nr:DNA mismatch repair endonuclease MutL [Vicinamibacterales bacterium]